MDHLIIAFLNFPVDLDVSNVQVRQVLEDVIILPARN